MYTWSTFIAPQKKVCHFRWNQKAPNTGNLPFRTPGTGDRKTKGLYSTHRSGDQASWNLEVFATGP